MPELTLVSRAWGPGGAVTGSPEVVAQQGAADVGVRNGYIYYGTLECGRSDGSIRRFATNTSGPPQITTLGSWPHGGYGMVPGADSLFVLIADSAAATPCDIISLPLGAGGASTTLACESREHPGPRDG